MAPQPLSFRVLAPDEHPRFKYALSGTHVYGLKRDYPRCALEDETVKIARGALTLKHGYQWDGPSGPAIDTANWLWASLVHDALYHLIEVGALPMKYRAAADHEMRLILLDNGMGWFRRGYSWLAVRMFGGRRIRRMRQLAAPRTK